MSQSTIDRDEAARLAPENFEEALAIARNVSNPWFKAQALALVAKEAPAQQFIEIIEESLEAAKQGKDTYERSAVLAWPLYMLTIREHHDRANVILESCLDQLENFRNLSSKSEVLLLVYQSMFNSPVLAEERILNMFVQTAQPGIGWRPARNAMEAFLMLASKNLDHAYQRMYQLPESSRYRKTGLKKLADGESLSPRSF